MKVSIDIDDKLNEALAGVIAKIDKRKLLDAAGAALASVATRSFREQGKRPSAWAPLSPNTIRQRNAQKYSRSETKGVSKKEHKTDRQIARGPNKTELRNMEMTGGLAHGNVLIDTGALVQSIIAQNNTGESVNVSSAVPYAGYLQYGTKKMPARPFLPFDPGTGELSEAGKIAVEDAVEAELKSMFADQ